MTPMSEINPVETTFAVQRDTIERSREFVSQSFEQQRQFVEEYLATVDEAFDAFLRTHEQVEAQVGEAAETVEIDVE